MTTAYLFPRRYHLSLSTFAGIAPGASHWWCRVRWEDEAGKDHEASAERGRGAARSERFDTRAAAAAAGLRMVRRLAAAGGHRYIVTEGTWGIADPRRCLSAPGNLKSRLNLLWRRFEALDGWDGPKAGWPAVQAVCDSWSSLVGSRR